MTALLRVGIINIIRTNTAQRLLKKCHVVTSNIITSRSVSVTSPEGDVDPRNLTEEDWLKRLTSEQYFVCREKGTEEPFTGKYYMHKEEGIYSCICCGSELFSSKSKYDSGTGWPAFYEPVSVDSKVENNGNNSVLLRPDISATGTTLTEVICKKCDGHLGHVFKDGPQPTGVRYCINSTSLKFVPKKLSPKNGS